MGKRVVAFRQHGIGPALEVARTLSLCGSVFMHALRLLASGDDIALVSKRLGHSSISVTSDIYTRLIGDAARRAAESALALVPRASAQRVHDHGTAADTTEARNLATSA